MVVGDEVGDIMATVALRLRRSGGYSTSRNPSAVEKVELMLILALVQLVSLLISSNSSSIRQLVVLQSQVRA